MDVFLFIAALIISLIFLFAGIAKLFKSYESLNERMQWTQEKSVGFIRFIAVSEIAGSIGFFLPYYLNIVPVLSTISAVGLIVLMIGAPITHFKLGEDKEAAFTTMLLMLIALVTFLRIFYV